MTTENLQFKKGQIVFLDEGFSNCSKVEIVEQTPAKIFTVVKNLDSHETWTVMSYRLSIINENMKKEEILEKIAESLEKESSNKKRNSMGVSESYYNSFFLVGKCFSKEELSGLTEAELNNLIKLSTFASECFY